MTTMDEGHMGGTAGEATQPKQDRILRRREAAWMLGRSLASVDRLTTRGVIKKVTFRGYKRAAGVKLSDIARLIATGGNVDSDGDGDDQHYSDAFADR